MNKIQGGKIFHTVDFLQLLFMPTGISQEKKICKLENGNVSLQIWFKMRLLEIGTMHKIKNFGSWLNTFKILNTPFNTKYYQCDILKCHFDMTFSSPGSVSGSQVLSITLHKEPQPAEPAELAGATATQTKKAVLSQGQRTVACFDLLFRQPSAGPSELVWRGQHFPEPLQFLLI